MALVGDYGKPLKFLDIELTNRCALRCPRCARTQVPLTKEKRDIDLEFFKRAFPERSASVLKGTVFNIEGTYGDAIYHPELIAILRYLKETFSAKIILTTNGSGKSENFWRELVGVLTTDDEIEFSIDGDEHTNQLYRVGADFSTITTALKQTCHKLIVRWKMIYFSHNENEVDRIRNIAESYGVNEFLAVKSKRFSPGKKDDDLKPQDESLISVSSNNRRLIKDLLKKGKEHSQVVLDPFCLRSNVNPHFLSYDGFLSPCCVTGIYFERTPDFPFISAEELRKMTDLRLRPIDEVLADKRWESFEGLRDQNFKQFKECYKRCGVLCHSLPESKGESHHSYLGEDRVLRKFR